MMTTATKEERLACMIAIVVMTGIFLLDTFFTLT